MTKQIFAQPLTFHFRVGFLWHFNMREKSCVLLYFAWCLKIKISGHPTLVTLAFSTPELTSPLVVLDISLSATPKCPHPRLLWSLFVAELNYQFELCFVLLLMRKSRSLIKATTMNWSDSGDSWARLCMSFTSAVCFNDTFSDRKYHPWGCRKLAAAKINQ